MNKEKKRQNKKQTQYRKQTSKGKIGANQERERLLTIENKLMVTRGEVGRGMGKIGDAD